MTEFDAYNPQSWFDGEGFLLPVRVVMKSASATTRRAVTAVAVSVAAMATSYSAFDLAFQIGAAPAAVSRFKTQSTVPPVVDGDAIRPGYWQDMAALLKSLPKLPDDDMSDDPPPFV